MIEKISYDNIATKKAIRTDQDFELVFNQIRDYAREHQLSPDSVREYFNQGIAQVLTVSRSV